MIHPQISAEKRAPNFFQVVSAHTNKLIKLIAGEEGTFRNWGKDGENISVASWQL